MDNENIESTPEQSEIKEEESFINDEITEEFGELLYFVTDNSLTQNNL